MIKLSILVPSVPSRLEFYLPRLIKQLELQIGNRSDVELLVFYDNKKRKTGHKRNDLLNLAQGEYLVFIDDDDVVADTYIEDILKAIELNPDCIVFDCITTIADEKNIKVHCKYGIEYEYRRSGAEWWGKPAHTMVWRSNIAKKHIYQHINDGEDTDWVKRACLDIKKQIRIDKVLYYYDSNSRKSER